MALLIGLEETREACCGLGPFKATVGCLSKEMACGAAACVVGSLHPHRGRPRPPRQLVLVHIDIAGADDEQHLQPHVSAAAGCGRVKLVPC